MVIVFVTTVGDKRVAIMDTNDGVEWDLIDGSPRIGCQVEKSGERWRVVGNNVSADCMNGICDYQPPQGK